MFNSATAMQYEFEEFAANESTEREASGLSNEKIAVGLEEIARRLPDDARNHGRRRQLGRAAALIRASPRSVASLTEAEGVEGVHQLGIEYELSGIVTDWVRTGRLPWLERLKAEQQAELLKLPNIGPRLARELRDVLGVVDLDGLARAAEEGRLQSVCGFGPKRIKLVAELLAARASRSRVQLDPARAMQRVAR